MIFRFNIFWFSLCSNCLRRKFELIGSILRQSYGKYSPKSNFASVRARNPMVSSVKKWHRVMRTSRAILWFGGRLVICYFQTQFAFLVHTCHGELFASATTWFLKRFVCIKIHIQVWIFDFKCISYKYLYSKSLDHFNEMVIKQKSLHYWTGLVDDLWWRSI